MSTPNWGASGGPCGGLEERKSKDPSSQLDRQTNPVWRKPTGLLETRGGSEVAVPESPTVFDFPAAHRVRLRTTRPYTHQPGTATTHPGRLHLPQPRFLPASGLGLARRTRRRMSPTRSISTSTHNPIVMSADSGIYRKWVEQSLLGALRGTRSCPAHRCVAPARLSPQGTSAYGAGLSR